MEVAINIVDKAIKKEENDSFIDYLVKTKEMMSLALSIGTFIEFAF